MFDTVKYTRNLLEAVLSPEDLYEDYDDYQDECLTEDEGYMKDLMEDIEFGLELLENEVFRTEMSNGPSDRKRIAREKLLDSGVAQNSKIDRHSGYKNQSALANHLYGKGKHEDSGLMDSTTGYKSANGAIQIVHKPTGKHVATITHEYEYHKTGKQQKAVNTHDNGLSYVSRSGVFGEVKRAVQSHPDVKGDWSSLEVRHVHQDEKAKNINLERRRDRSEARGKLAEFNKNFNERVAKRLNKGPKVDHSDIVDRHAQAITHALNTGDHTSAKYYMKELAAHVEKHAVKGGLSHLDGADVVSKLQYRRKKMYS